MIPERAEERAKVKGESAAFSQGLGDIEPGPEVLCDRAVALEVKGADCEAVFDVGACDVSGCHEDAVSRVVGSPVCRVKALSALALLPPMCHQ